MKVLPVFVSSNSYDIFDSPNEGIGRCFTAKGPKVTQAQDDLPPQEHKLKGKDKLQ